MSSLPPQNAWVFVGCLVHSTDSDPMEIKENAAIGIKDGKIVFVESADKLVVAMKTHSIAEDRVIHLSKGQFLMPGFIDCHAHASQYSFLGTGTDVQLLDWLNKYTFPAERQLGREKDYGLGVYQKCVDRTLRYGTTTISYYATISRQSTMALVQAIERRGQRAFVGKVNMDVNSPNDYTETEQNSIQETQLFVKEMLDKKSSTITPCVTPRFAFSCTMKLMKELATIAKTNNLPIQTHLSENKKEIQGVLKLHSGASTYTDVYDQAGLVGSKTLLAHAIHLSKQELELIKKKQAGICHCPNSNFILTSGVMDLRHLMNMGIKVGLGTDFGAGASPSMLDAMRRGLEAVKIHDMIRNGLYSINGQGQCDHDASPASHSKAQQKDANVDVPLISYKHLFRLATLGGSKVMDLDQVIGNFQVNKEFDAIVVDINSAGSPIDSFPSDTTEDLIQKFIFLGDDRNITRVFVQGREVFNKANPESEIV